MSRSYYDVLGVSRQATAAEIKRAYRKLVLKLHPDRSPEGPPERFIEVAKAYEVLGDPARRKEYDRLQDINAKLRETSAAKPPPPAAKPRPQPDPQAALRADLAQLMRHAAKGNMKEAEPLARKILAADPRQSLPYAVLGDLYRSRGELREAGKMYAYAAQYEPGNPAYLRRHEEMLDVLERAQADRELGPGSPEGRWVAPMVGTMLCVTAACYVALAPEASVFAAGTPFSTWTIGLLSMLLFSGAVMGATLSLADLVERFELANTFGRLSPSFVFMALAIVNLWVAAALYLLVGSLLKSFSLSLSRMLLALVAVVAFQSMGAAASHTIDPYQTLLWGGSVAAFGAVLGWAFADGLRGV